MSRVLTFDLGTTYFKVCLFDEDMRLVALSRVAVPVESPSRGRCELPVSVFCRVLTDAVQEVGRQAGGLRDVKSVSFASQANTFTLLDESFQPLLPFLMWTDQRALEMTGKLTELTQRHDFYPITGVAELNHLFLPAKLLWLNEQEPGIISRTRRLCLLSDYLVWWLTGNHLSEGSLAGLTGMVDIHSACWWTEATQFAGIPREWLAEIERAGVDAGELRKDRAQELGLPANCRCVMGCLDQYAGAIGAGTVIPGRISETTGTVLATVRRAREFIVTAPSSIYQGPAATEGEYYQMVFSSISAGLLERYRNALPDRPMFAELDQLAAQVPSGADGLQLHPNAAELPLEEMFVNRLPRHTRGHEVRAIMEGVAIELRNHVATLCGRNWPTSIRAAGGAARSAVWLKIKTDVVGCPVEPVQSLEPTSLGAARLASSKVDRD